MNQGFKNLRRAACQELNGAVPKQGVPRSRKKRMKWRREGMGADPVHLERGPKQLNAADQKEEKIK